MIFETSIQVHVDKEDVLGEYGMIFGSGCLSYPWWGSRRLSEDGKHLIIDAMLPDSDKPDMGRDSPDTVIGDDVWRTYYVDVIDLAELAVEKAGSIPGLLDITGKKVALEIGEFDADISDRVLQEAVYGGLMFA